MSDATCPVPLFSLFCLDFTLVEGMIVLCLHFRLRSRLLFLYDSDRDSDFSVFFLSFTLGGLDWYVYPCLHYPHFSFILQCFFLALWLTAGPWRVGSPRRETTQRWVEHEGPAWLISLYLYDDVPDCWVFFWDPISSLLHCHILLPADVYYIFLLRFEITFFTFQLSSRHYLARAVKHFKPWKPSTSLSK